MLIFDVLDVVSISKRLGVKKAISPLKTGTGVCIYLLDACAFLTRLFISVTDRFVFLRRIEFYLFIRDGR